MINKILVWVYNKIAFLQANFRAKWWRLFVKKMGENVHIMTGVRILSPAGVSIGHHVYINHHTDMSGKGGLTIGNYVKIGPFCNIQSVDHVYTDWQKPMFSQGMRPDPIVIEDDVWVAANVVIVPGVTIGRGAIVGANAVVTRDVEPYAIVGGVPARVIKYRFDKETIEKAKQVDLDSTNFS